MVLTYNTLRSQYKIVTTIDERLDSTKMKKGERSMSEEGVKVITITIVGAFGV